MDWVATVQAVYRELESRPIERNCARRTECCQFKLTGEVPQLTKAEAMLAAKAWKATGRKELPQKADGSCPCLGNDGRCLIYEARPFGCRTHFCAAAGGPYERREVLDLIQRLEDMDRQFGGDGPRRLEEAMRLELKQMW